LEAAAETDISGKHILSTEGERIHENFRRELSEEALALKLKTLEQFQEKAIRWIKTQFRAATTATSIILAVFAYAGFKGCNASEKYQQLAKESEQAIEEKLSSIDRATEKIKNTSESVLANIYKENDSLNKKVDSVEKLIEKKMKDLDEFNTKKIRDYQEELRVSVDEIGKLQKRTARQLDRSDQQLEKIKRLENSRFRILVHYRDDAIKSYQDNIELMKKTLFKKGFIIEKKNISNVSADKQEIIRYSESQQIKNKVEEIQQQLTAVFNKKLSGNFNPIPIKCESAASVDPLQVVIKLCPQAKANADGYCYEANSTANNRHTK
jgi:dGTP triphosphohydrolase